MGNNPRLEGGRAPTLVRRPRTFATRLQSWIYTPSLYPVLETTWIIWANLGLAVLYVLNRNSLEP